MSSCKKICLYPDCSSSIYYYANYSRYHGFCQAHFPPNEPRFTCKICENIIIYNSTIPFPIKAEYKNQMRIKQGLPEKTISEIKTEPENSLVISNPAEPESIQASIYPSNTELPQIQSILDEKSLERKQIVLVSIFNKKESYQINEEKNFFYDKIEKKEDNKENCTFLEYLKKKTKNNDEKVGNENKAKDDENNISENEKIISLQLNSCEKVVESIEKMSYKALEKSINETNRLALCYKKLKEARENDRRIIKSELKKIEMVLNYNSLHHIENIINLLDRDIFKSLEDSSNELNQY
ncbi:hypothetical protein SteCoe_3606 [Stentor coeruleus]|uniref:Uncharacterized protein n=1 Tax=Stentor coeruleus TaxID=5963 RepID=A0A1R2CWY1_9CILI|nr:hypothetical protein SteCoe_3606 [Stentor coeruleus]